MIISRAPFRISFFGGGTDFPDFFERHGGCTLSTSIGQYCYVLIHPVSPCHNYKYKVSYARTEVVNDVAELKHPLVREVLLSRGITESLEIGHVSDMPARTGLGSSSSFTICLLNAVHRLKNETTTPMQLAQEAIHVERILVGDPGGHQDQYAAAFGGLNRIDYSAERTEVTPVILSEDRIHEIESHLMLFYLGDARSSAPILRSQQKRTPKNEHNLLRMKQIVDDAQTILTSSENLDELGFLLAETWRLKKTLAGRISTPEIDAAYAEALDAGAWGGKLLGAGGGGFLMLFAKPDRRRRIIERLKGLQEVNVTMEFSGATTVYEGNAA
jgi:D-glycero-alpha-D-manno-heptose-7-phosphate kinase